MSRFQQIIRQGILSQQRILVKDDAFITTWNIPTDGFTLIFPTEALAGHSFDYNIDWGDGSPTENITDPTAPTHTYQSAGIYKVRARGVIPRWIISNNAAIKGHLLEVYWGNVGFQYLQQMFAGCSNLETIKGNVVLFGSLRSMFYNCSKFQADTSKWEVRNMSDMQYLFRNANLFNGKIGHWDVSTCKNFYFTLASKSFNQDISGWDVSSATRMNAMFDDARAFNQDISGWDVHNVTNMNYMFRNCESFNQDLSGWCVEKITAKPTSFDLNTPAWEKEGRQPLWGAPCL